MSSRIRSSSGIGRKLSIYLFKTSSTMQSLEVDIINGSHKYILAIGRITAPHIPNQDRVPCSREIKYFSEHYKYTKVPTLYGHRRKLPGQQLSLDSNIG